MQPLLTTKATRLAAPLNGGSALGRCALALFGSPTSRRNWLIVLAVAFLFFGILTEIRSAFLKRRMTDFGVYARGAWAIRAGADLYAVTDNNDWHYIYPPTLAILMSPLADPPPGAPRFFCMPYALGVAIWYALGVVALGFALENLARCIERMRPDPFDVRQFGRAAVARSNLLRFVPFLAALPHVGNTLSRGQVGTIWLWLTVGVMVGMATRRSMSAGFFLAGAICLKIIPAFLLLAPIVRRDRRMALGVACGTIVGLIVLPVLTMGPLGAMATCQSFVSRVLAPGIGRGSDQTLAAELTDVTATRSQAPMSILHHWRHWGLDRYQRPSQPVSTTRLAHWIIAVAFTIVVLAADRRQRGEGPMRDLSLLSNLTVAMMVASPVCHMHYFILCTPLMFRLLVRDFDCCGGIRAPTFGLFAFFLAVSTATLLPGSQRLQDSGILMAAALALVLYGIAPFGRCARTNSSDVLSASSRRAA